MTTNNTKQCGQCCEYFAPENIISDYRHGSESHICKKCQAKYKIREAKQNKKSKVELVIVEDDEDDSEYMNEPMDCVVCDRTDIPRKLLHWNECGSYTAKCEECKDKCVNCKKYNCYCDCPVFCFQCRQCWRPSQVCYHRCKV